MSRFHLNVELIENSELLSEDTSEVGHSDLSVVHSRYIRVSVVWRCDVIP
jgi:hypothetical protein